MYISYNCSCRFRQICIKIICFQILADFSDSHISTDFDWFLQICIEVICFQILQTIGWSTDFERFAHRLSIFRFYQKFRVTDFDKFWEICTPIICFQILPEIQSDRFQHILRDFHTKYMFSDFSRKYRIINFPCAGMITVGWFCLGNFNKILKFLANFHELLINF